MGKKIKIIFILIILSVTPFLRGCHSINEPSETIIVGFPATIMNMHFQQSAMGVFRFSESYPMSVYPHNFIINIIILFSIAILIFLKDRYIKIPSIFLNATLVNLFLCWFTAFIIFRGYNLNFINKLYYFAYQCIALFFNFFIVQLTPLKSEPTELVTQIVSRPSFFVITFIIALIFYFIRRIFNLFKSRVTV
ncbi:MAG: hypothetical protein COV71_05900 [Candidatus Omnitrophica bacterium CG11_big_fil_rev_8_21_14_0_20_41_12]|nr:MAG: hypothetical protein COV71_05900 [Candidatus Omnitrophica bacterium CG11_big_fil_rev_8_21_14_0_20_41_12]